MRGIICGALMALTMAASNAEEDPFSMNALLRYCRPSGKTESAFLNGACIGMVTGVLQTLGLVKSIQGNKLDPFLCIDKPEGVTPDQAVRIVIKFSEAHPELTHESLIPIAAFALHEAWPCKN